eukprot:scaffold10482_cov89-Skeletonema_marinoi.AAC.7
MESIDPEEGVVGRKWKYHGSASWKSKGGISHHRRAYYGIMLVVITAIRCRAIKSSSPHVEFEHSMWPRTYYVAHAAQPTGRGS